MPKRKDRLKVFKNTGSGKKTAFIKNKRITISGIPITARIST